MLWKIIGRPQEAVVYTQFKYIDNTTSPIFSDTIIYDPIKPLGKVLINNGARETDTTSVKVSLKIIGNESEVEQMIVSNYQHFSNSLWEPFRKEFDWELLPLTGRYPRSRFVYIRLKDYAGNISPILRGVIILRPS